MTSTKQVFGVGLRGAGQVAREHAKAINNNPNLFIAAVCSRTEESARRLSHQYAPEAKVYRDYEDMLSDPRVDVVAISMPNYLHAREAILAFQAERHLILEKPVAINRQEIEDLRAAAEKTNQRSVVSFVLRWNPLVKMLRSLLDRNAIGDIFYAEVDYWHGIKQTYANYEWVRQEKFAGGAMITGGCHACDMIRYLKGEIREVSAYRTKTREDFDYCTTLVAAVQFKDGSVGKLSATMDGINFPYSFNIDLLGSEGIIRDNRIYSKVLFPEQDDFITLSSTTPDSGAVAHHPFQQEVDNLVESILHDAHVLSDVTDACRSMEIALAIEESAKTGKSVSIK